MIATVVGWVLALGLAVVCYTLYVRNSTLRTSCEYFATELDKLRQRPPTTPAERRAAGLGPRGSERYRR